MLVFWCSSPCSDAVAVYLVSHWMVDALPSRLTKIQCGFILVALSYPVLFAVDRGNLELLVFVCLGGFFYNLYVRGSWRVAAIFLGAAIALETSTRRRFFVLLLAERRYRTAVLSVLVALGANRREHDHDGAAWARERGGRHSGEY